MAASIKLTLKSDPFRSDPPRASELYEAVGRYIRVWSHLEEHFNSALIAMLKHPAVFEIRDELKIESDGPISFSRKLKLWRRLWSKVPSFTTFEKGALEFAARLSEANTDRNKLLHSAWQTFTDVDSLAVKSSSWSLKGGSIVVSPIAFDLSEVKEMTAIADDLNSRLVLFTLVVVLPQRPAHSPKA